VKIAVYIADGRTVHLLEKRAHLIDLVTRKLDAIDRAQPIACMTRRHRDGDFEPSRLMYLRPGSVSQVEPVVVEAISASVEVAA